MGQGWVGNVVEVISISGQSTELNYFSGALVAKFPNRILGFPGPLSKAQSDLRKEWRLFQELKRIYPEIQRDKRFPQFSGWSSDQPPVVPILGIEETTDGPFVLKTKVPPGSFPKDLAQIFKANGGRLTSEMEESLFHIYEFLQVSGQKLGIWPDARAANLVWISDPGMMKILGFKIPNFAMLEFSPGPLPTYSEPLNSYWGFRSEFLNLLRLELFRIW
ncbi:MAG: hypothetical protein K2X47_17555 [Bdellovibrionales bacterium]|nr:hypothetical protein [Bdellovibrionales bacterium]